MTPTPLALVQINGSLPAVSAGWLATPDPVEWLRELAHCRRLGCEVAIYPVAASPAEPRTVGVLLMPRGKVPQFRARVQPLAELLPGVHGPLDAALSAGLLAHERGFFFPYPLHFFHPACGLVGFEPRDELAPENLLERPPERGCRWNLAVPGEGFAPSLKSILVAAPPDPGEMLEEAAREIGDRAGSPKMGEGLVDKAALLGKGVAGGALLGVGFVAGLLGKVAGLVGGYAFPGRFRTGEGSLDRLLAWAEQNWQLLADHRKREINRLMNLMETDPDAGLRFALPLTGIEQSRGRAAPTWQLQAKNVRYSLGHGGGAIDGWDLANEERLKLERQYREAAKREIALGRFERAAYVFGNLLGDWNSAAKALADGGLPRDAVAIYLHKLNNRPAAAKCLEDAGLLLQAAAIYAECRRFEQAGDLHARLGNDAQARELWLAALDDQRDPLEKARLLADKLRDHPAALILLDQTWQAGIRPEAALTAMFGIHRQAAATAEAVSLLRRVFGHPLASLSLAAKLKLGHDQATRWADPVLTAELEQQAYLRIGQALSAGGGDSRALLEFLPQLDPDDLLLARDAKRFQIAKHPPKVPASGAPQGNLRPTKVIRIAPRARWSSLATLPDGVSIAGHEEGLLAVARFQNGTCHRLTLRIADDPGKSRIRHFAACSGRSTSLVFHFPAYKRLYHHPLDRSRTDEDRGLEYRRNILAAGPFKEHGDFALLEYTRTSSLSIHLYSETAALRRTFPIDLAPPEVTAMNWLMAGRDGHLCLAAEGFLAWRYGDGRMLTMGLGEAPAGLGLSPAVIQPEVLVTLSTEVLLIEVPHAAQVGKKLATVNLYSGHEERQPPVGCYLPDGSIVVAHRGGGRIYPPQDRITASATLSVPPDAGTPIDVCASGAGGFAILTDTGNLIVFGG
jgi:tetratricopeptide (TPR) repeat protein